MSIRMLIVSMLWFIVRAILEMPSGTPLFCGTVFAWADTLAVVFGVVGVVSLVLEYVYS